MENPNFKIAMFGPSGGGKTTLAKLIPLLVPVTFIPGSVHKIFTEEQQQELLQYGYVCGEAGHRRVINLSSINPEFGGKFQKYAILERRKMILEKDNFVTDRSPVDNLTYFHLQCSHNQSEQAIRDMIDICQDTYSNLTHAIYVKSVLPEGVAIEDNESRVPNKYFQVMVDQIFEAFYFRYFAFPTNMPVKAPKVLVIDFWDIEMRAQRLMKFFGVHPNIDEIMEKLYNIINIQKERVAKGLPKE